MARYKMDFHCKTCAKMEQIGESWYCMPIRSGYDPLWVEDETRTIHCQEYRDRQFSMFDEEVKDE